MAKSATTTVSPKTKKKRPGHKPSVKSGTPPSWQGKTWKDGRSKKKKSGGGGTKCTASLAGPKNPFNVSPMTKNGTTKKKKKGGKKNDNTGKGKGITVEKAFRRSVKHMLRRQATSPPPAPSASGARPAERGGGGNKVLSSKTGGPLAQRMQRIRDAAASRRKGGAGGARNSRNNNSNNKNKNKKNKAKTKKKKGKRKDELEWNLPPLDHVGTLRSVPWRNGVVGDRHVWDDNVEEEDDEDEVDASDREAVDGGAKDERQKSAMASVASAAPLLGDVLSDNNFLRLFDAEIRRFAKYVRPTDGEAEARRGLVRRVQQLSEEIFGGGGGGVDGIGKGEVRVDTFGSFACLPVCTYASDVDMVLWGAVDLEGMMPNAPAPQRPPAAIPIHTSFSTGRRRSSSSNPDGTSKEEDYSRRRRRIDRWHEVLSASDERVARAIYGGDAEGGGKDGDDECVGGRGGRSGNSEDPIDITNSSDDSDCSSGESAVSVGRRKKRKSSASEKNGSGISLEEPIEIPDDDDDDDGVGDGSSSTGKGKDDSVDDDYPSSSTDDEPDPMDAFVASAVAADGEGNDDDDRSTSSSCSSDDSVGPLGDEPPQFQVSFVSPTSEHTARRSGPASSAETAEASDGVADDLGKPPELPKPVRKKIVSVLYALGKALRRDGLAIGDTLDVRRRAKVPIVAFRTEMGVDGDVSVGGRGIGSDTSAYAGEQCRRYKSFAPVVMLLKILLCQSDLDKPFTGGLGSYKLYVLVAYHIERHVAAGGSDRPAEILVSLLYRFGDSSEDHSELHRHRRPGGLVTKLTKDNPPLRSGGGVCDLQPVFKIHHCAEVFGRAFERLVEVVRARRNRGGSYTPAGGAGDGAGAETSFVGSIIDSSLLSRARMDALERSKRAKSATGWGMDVPSSTMSMTATMTNRSRTHGNVFSASRGRVTTQTTTRRTAECRESDFGRSIRYSQTVSTTLTSIGSYRALRGCPPPSRWDGDEEELNTDEEAERLMSGYGMKRSASGNPVPVDPRILG